MALASGLVNAKEQAKFREAYSVQRKTASGGKKRSKTAPAAPRGHTFGVPSRYLREYVSMGQGIGVRQCGMIDRVWTVWSVDVLWIVPEQPLTQAQKIRACA